MANRQATWPGPSGSVSRPSVPASTGVLIYPSDHPLVSPATITACIAIQHTHRNAIIIPSYQGRRGHPTLFPRPVIEELYFAATLRDVIAANAGLVRLAEVDDDGVVLDLDTPDDYERIKGRFS
jgi:molybdenum cofactor cytidylyltransferase